MHSLHCYLDQLWYSTGMVLEALFVTVGWLASLVAYSQVMLPPNFNEIPAVVPFSHVIIVLCHAFMKHKHNCNTHVPI